MLDINTERGQESLTQERLVQELIKQYWNVTIIETPKESAAACDGFFVSNGIITGIFETKCRDDMNYLELMIRGSWLITYAKITKGRLLSKLLQVPYYGILYLVNERDTDVNLLYTKITSSKGEFLYEIPTEQTKTQETINGGEIQRENAYIPVEVLSFVKPGVFIE